MALFGVTSSLLTGDARVGLASSIGVPKIG